MKLTTINPLHLAESEHDFVVTDALMHPTLTHSDVCVVDTSDTDQNDGLFHVQCVGVDGVRRIQFEGDMVNVIADNPLQPNKALPCADVHLVGKVGRMFKVTKF